MTSLLSLLLTVVSMVLILLSQRYKNSVRENCVMRNQLCELERRYDALLNETEKNNRNTQALEEMTLEIIQSGHQFREMATCPECGKQGKCTNRWISGLGVEESEFKCECWCRWRYSEQTNKIDDL